MHDDDHEDWAEEKDDSLNKQHMEIQKLFSEMERKAKKAMHYLELEGFV